MNFAMRLTTEQINAEVESLSKLANGKLAAAGEIINEFAHIMHQIELLKKLRAVRMEMQHCPEADNFIALLGIVKREEDEPTPFCAVIWANESVSPTNVRLFVKVDWDQIVPLEIVPYFAKLMEDWKVLLRTSPETLLAFVSDLSVGPLRTIETGKLDPSRATARIREKLGRVLEFP